SEEREFSEEAYAAAVAARADVLAAVEKAFLDHNLDALVYPTVRNRQVFTGEPQTGSQCQLAAHSGMPALSMPVGLSDQGLPIGMELLGLPFDDAKLLAIAWPYEQQVQPRQPPSVTPPLVDGRAPETTVVELEFRSGTVALDGRFEFDTVTNQLRYELNSSSSNRASIYAATLVLEAEEGSDSSGPVVLNLISPASSGASGTYFMDKEFREGFGSGRIYLKVFAEGLPAIGVSQLLQ
ncbi:MAG: amidase family protein, partial [Gammaproteobacteria bacterium]